MMDFKVERITGEISENIDSFAEGVKETLNDINNKFVSNVMPNHGTFGDVTKFATELVPGVAEYNALKEGDYLGFATAAGIDVGSIIVGSGSGGTGYAITKGLAREVTEKGIKEVVKDVTVKVGRSFTGESVDKIVKNVGQEASEAGSRIFKNDFIKESSKLIGDSIQDMGPKLVDPIKRIDNALFDKPLIGQFTTSNFDSMLGKYHPETKVPFKMFHYYKDGKVENIVAPDFPHVVKITLPKELWGASFNSQSKELNKLLKNEFEKNPNHFENLNREQIEQIKFGFKPDGYTWHHGFPNGVMELVDSEVHRKTSHKGGMSTWGSGHK